MSHVTHMNASRTLLQARAVVTCAVIDSSCNCGTSQIRNSHITHMNESRTHIRMRHELYCRLAQSSRAPSLTRLVIVSHHTYE